MTHLLGQLSVDGVPVEKGSVSFIADQGATHVATVAQGKFEIDAPVGHLRVMFQGTRETGGQVKMFDVPQPEVVNVIPFAFQSGMEIDVAQGQTEVKFDLKSK
jgi:hypothetical protein